MTHAQIEDAINKYLALRDNDMILEEIVSEKSIRLRIKTGQTIEFPKHVELHRFIIKGRRTN